MKIERVELIKTEDTPECDSVHSPDPVADQDNLSMSRSNFSNYADQLDTSTSKGDKLRRDRTRFTPNQKMEMERIFMHSQHPDFNIRCSLAEKIGLKDTVVQVWFKNRRSRFRKEMSQRNHSNPVSSTTNYNQIGGTSITPAPIHPHSSQEHYWTHPPLFSPPPTVYTGSMTSPMVANSYSSPPMQASTPTCSRYLSPTGAYNNYSEFTHSAQQYNMANQHQPTPAFYNPYQSWPSTSDSSPMMSSVTNSSAQPETSFMSMMSTIPQKQCSYPQGEFFDFLP